LPPLAPEVTVRELRGLTEYTGEGREQDGIPTTFTYDADPSTGSGPAAGLRRQSQTAGGGGEVRAGRPGVLLETTAAAPPGPVHERSGRLRPAHRPTARRGEHLPPLRRPGLDDGADRRRRGGDGHVPLHAFGETRAAPAARPIPSSSWGGWATTMSPPSCSSTSALGGTTQRGRFVSVDPLPVEPPYNYVGGRRRLRRPVRDPAVAGVRRRPALPWHEPIRVVTVCECVRRASDRM